MYLCQAVDRSRKSPPTPRGASVGATNEQWPGWPQNETGYLRRIAVKTGTETSFIRIEDVDYLESAGNYTVLIVGKANHLLRETLTHLEDSLPRRMFLRISRSILVNLERIKSLQTSPTGEPIIVLQDNRQLKTTRNAKEIQNKPAVRRSPRIVTAPWRPYPQYTVRPILLVFLLATFGLSAQIPSLPPNQESPAILLVSNQDSRLQGANTTIPIPGASDLRTGSEELVPAGSINFPATDLNQVLQIYAELVGRTVLRPTSLRMPHDHTQDPDPANQARSDPGFRRSSGS